MNLQEFPYIEAEVRYAVKEYAATAVDVIARRLRLVLTCDLVIEPILNMFLFFTFVRFSLQLFTYLFTFFRLAFLNNQAAQECLPRIIEIMGEELKWSNAEKIRQMDMALNFLKTQMGKDANRQAKDSIPISLTRDEISKYVTRFSQLGMNYAFNRNCTNLFSTKIFCKDKNFVK